MSKRICLQSCDGELFEIEEEVVSMCATVKNMLKGKSAFRNSLGGQFSIDGSYVILKKEGRVLASLMKNDDEEAIFSLPDVKSGTLEKVIEYCKFHNTPTNTDREKKAWDAEFVQVKQSILCELASASYYLDIKPLVNLTSRAIATQISVSGLDVEVHPSISYPSSLATRCRLQRKYNRKKLLDDKETTPASSNNSSIIPSLSENDDRSVEELLEFITDGKAENQTNHKSSSSLALSSSAEISTKKKTKKTKKKNKKSSQSNNTDHPRANESQGRTERTDGHHPEHEVEEDGLDPQMKADLDKEVEEFRQRLESMNTQNPGSKPKITLPVSTSSFLVGVGVH